MTRIAQMQVRFNPVEDRLLLRIRSGSGVELRFWLTRRYLRLAWPTLAAGLESPATGVAAVDRGALARKEVAAFEHQDALQRSDFNSQFEEGAGEYPLGPSPVLLARFALKTRDGKDTVVCLHPLRGQGIEVAMSRTLLHAFCKLLADGAIAAAWNLPITLPQPAAGAGERPH